MQEGLTSEDVMNFAKRKFETRFKESSGLTIDPSMNLDTVPECVPAEFRQIADEVIEDIRSEGYAMTGWQVRRAFVMAAKSLPRAQAAPAKPIAA